MDSRFSPFRLNGRSRFNSRLSLIGSTARGIPRLVAFWLTGYVTSVAASTCVVLEGNPVQGGVLWGQTAPDAEIRFAGIQVPVLNDGHFLLGLGRDMPAANELVVITHDACAQEVKVAAREYRVQRIEGVPQQTVTPSEEHLDRIRRERSRDRRVGNSRC